MKSGHAKADKCSVEAKSKEYDDGFDEGFFYYLGDFINLRAGPEKTKEPQMQTIRQQVEYATDTLKATVIRDRDGKLGVRVSSLPGQAAYKYKVGACENVANVCARDFDNAEEAKDFAAEEFAELKGTSMRRRIVGKANPADLQEQPDGLDALATLTDRGCVAAIVQRVPQMNCSSQQQTCKCLGRAISNICLA